MMLKSLYHIVYYFFKFGAKLTCHTAIPERREHMYADCFTVLGLTQANKLIATVA